MGRLTDDVALYEKAVDTEPVLRVTSFQSGVWNLNNITGTISLPTNAAQETGGNLEIIAETLGPYDGKADSRELMLQVIQLNEMIYLELRKLNYMMYLMNDTFVEDADLKGGE